MSIAHLLEDTCTVQQPTDGRDTSGGPTNKPFTDLYPDVPCRVLDASPNQRMVFGALNMLVENIVITEQAGIANGHVIVTSDGRLIRVEGVEKVRAQGGIDTYYEVYGHEVRHGA